MLDPILVQCAAEAYSDDRAAVVGEYTLDPRSNEYAAIYTGPHTIFAVRGTIWFKPRDWIVNLAILFGLEHYTMRYKMLCYTLSMLDNVIVVGHSQGGTLARRLTLDYNNIIRTIMFNPGYSLPHLIDACCRNTDPRLCIVRMRGDIVSLLSRGSPNEVIVLADDDNEHHRLDNFSSEFPFRQ